MLKSKYNYDKIHTKGLLSDIDLLEHIRAGNFYDKLFAIVPESYFVFHNIDPPAGIVIAPRWEPTEYEDGFWNLWGLLTPLQLESEGWNLGGSWNVAFVKSDQKDAGTVAHELAHTLGQGRELYETQQQCQHLKMDQPQQCHESRIIPRALHTGIEKGKPFWKLVEEDKFTIMDDQSKIGQQWIDRDTYQKNLWVLSKLGSVIPPWKKLHDEADASLSLKEKKASLKVVVSGFYHEDQDAFINPKIKISRTKLQTASFYPDTENTKLPVVIFQLKEKNTVLEKIKRPIFKMEMELLYKNKPSKTVPFDFSHAMAAFKLPEDSSKRNLRVEILGPRGDMLYTAPVPKKRKNKKSKPKKNIGLIDKNH